MEKVLKILRLTYGLVPVVAGFDKFTNLLTDWKQYLSAPVQRILPFEAQTFMMIVGIIEIAAGLLVLIKPRYGAYLVMSWLILISLSLIIGGHYLDVAVRDLVMAIGAYSFARLLESQPENKAAFNKKDRLANA